MARIERERSATRSISINAGRTSRRRVSVSYPHPQFPVNQKNCSICLPVEIQMSVNIKSLDNRGYSRVRGGMAVESAENEHAHESSSTIETKQPLPVLQEILKKQRAILRNLTGQKSLMDKLNDDEERINEESDTKLSQKRDQHKRSEKPEDDSFSDGIKVNSNISFEQEDDEDDKKRKKKSKRLKGGKNDFQLPTSIEGIEGDIDVFPVNMEGGQMIELFNRQRVRDSKTETLPHRIRTTSRTRIEESTDDGAIEKKYDNQRREYDKDSRKFRGIGGGGGPKVIMDNQRRN